MTTASWRAEAFTDARVPGGGTVEEHGDGTGTQPRVQVARLPILRTDLALHGYELVFRESTLFDRFRAVDPVGRPPRSWGPCT